MIRLFVQFPKFTALSGICLLWPAIVGPGTAVADDTAEPIGVPRLDVDYALEVDQWWSGHRFNPSSPNYAPEIRSPEPVIDVAEVHARHPDSETAGIDEALALLPESGGTLFFAKSHGPYAVTKEPFEHRYAEHDFE